MKKNILSIIMMLTGLLLFTACGSKEEPKGDEPKTETQTEQKKVYKIGVTQIVDHPALNDSKKGFIDALKDAGLETEIDDKVANGEIPTQQLIAKQFAEDKKDLIFAIATPSAQAAATATDTIPVVFASVSDPKGAGLTNKANVTGTSGLPEIEKNLELLKKIFPNVKKVGIIYNTSEQNSVFQVEIAEQAGKKLGIEVLAEGVTSAPEFMAALEKLSRDIDVFFAIQDNTLSSSFPALLEKMNALKIPIFGANAVYTDRGALISQGTTDYDIGYRAGEMAAAILKGEKTPKDIPIEVVQKPKITINKKNMELLGIKIPDEVVKEASIME
ncbi:ABC transporter substrate-binding protein [Sebaldella sp. S0638]|uniref:ABC transporter substrate-binding protein n=1 Tax=Sebaldella sp. S0638 TaxID=2957809 RepID=UPI00209CD4E7|nr:ABC transporter substrate-binding protein [Sebaldella sp. S0638]MCP1226096.1 ABC transporter substrate-binding protein [Sebaldella sp. S0638]